MGCGCINRGLSTYDRIKELAKKFAKSEDVICVIYKCDMGYNFCIKGEEKGEIVEYITKYCK